LGVMPKMHASDEAIINGPPQVVYRAILNEYEGLHIGGHIFRNQT
jgi:hypothetical protein